ncbi:hypothetical protein OED01_02800 [Microbacterium sp. M28]|uniref:hypothetical protein n=1 Tax=Microbacterium sp. M28 TaxID=2962064 RepID=UPI0021F3FE4E|nr:hypothetical protein [Microbacterium sp. M28]UYO97668.1 hypothetical protein OED01_02800 [Microbacterium sp. M28]
MSRTSTVRFERRRGRSTVLAILAAVMLIATAASGALSASAAATVTWASWAPLGGGANAYTTAISFVDRPALSATVASDSRAGSVGVMTGASVWLSEGTPVGAKYGSSRNNPYLNLRPKADTATSPSTTTYSFDRPTPQHPAGPSRSATSTPTRSA